MPTFAAERRTFPFAEPQGFHNKSAFDVGFHLLLDRLFHLLQLLPIGGDFTLFLLPLSLFFADFLRQVFRFNNLPRAQDKRPDQGIFQLPDISRPGVIP